MDDHEVKCATFWHLEHHMYISLITLYMYKPHIIIIIIVVNFIIVICLYNVMYFQYTSLSIHLYKW